MIPYTFNCYKALINYNREVSKECQTLIRADWVTLTESNHSYED